MPLPTTQTPVVIIGAGISGLCIAIDLIRKFNLHDFVILEKSAGIGGTWFDNRYPGAACDVFSHLYSYSFEPNSEWTREYPLQDEILEYFIKVAEKWGLYSKIRFNTEVEEAIFDEENQVWNTTVKINPGTKEGEYAPSYTITSNFLVSCVGQLNQPYFPTDIPGFDTFQGRIMHSARWDKTYNYAGKKVCIIGNGATAVQIIPEIQKEAQSLTVFQRTPNWVVPRLDAPISTYRRLLYRIPPIRKYYRQQLMNFRESTYEPIVHPESEVAKGLMALSLGMLEAQVQDKDMREKLKANYPIGCKRVIISDDYYNALTKPNVTLETDPIASITPAGPVTLSGTHHNCDLLVLATGFKSQQFLHPITVRGVNSASISDIWDGAGAPIAHYGITVPHLPNFAMTYGPNTNLGHNSIILMIEAQSEYICQLIKPVLEKRVRSVTVKERACEKYFNEVQERLGRTSFASPSCRSWYKREDGLITNNWCGTVVEYQNRTKRVNWNDYSTTGGSYSGERQTISITITPSHAIAAALALGLSTIAAVQLGY